MAEAGTEAKEQTILSLSNQLNTQLDKLLFRLEDTFDRNVKPETGKGEDAPQMPNVLDQIISNQEESSRRIDELRKFVDVKVIPKIH